MLLGIYLHTAIAFMVGETDWAVRDRKAHWGFDVSLWLIHGFRMQLFFVLAGFFARLVRVRIGPWNFLKRRMLRIGVPFLAGMAVLLPMIYFAWTWGVSLHGRSSDSELGRIPDTIWDYPTGHLWFLEYLLCFYVGAFVLEPVMWLFTRGWIGVVLDWLARLFMRFPFKPLILPLAVVWFLVPKSTGETADVDNAGRALLPLTGAVAYYAVFFFFGWALHRGKAQLLRLSSTGAVLLHSLMLPVIVYLAFRLTREPWHSTRGAYFMTFYYLYSVYTWSMIFLAIGLMLKFFKRRHPWAEYMADASYWFYWMHLPIVIALQVVAARWETNGVLKCFWIIGVTCLLLWPTYHWCVRYTWVGRIMNGRRERPVT